MREAGMRVYLLGLCCLAVSQGYILEEEWNKFKATYNKNYIDDIDEEMRKQIFDENMAQIWKHNEKYKEGLVSYEMGMNQYGDMTQVEFEMVMLGVDNGLSNYATDKYYFLGDPYSTTPASETTVFPSTEESVHQTTEESEEFWSRNRLKRSLDTKHFLNSIRTQSLDKFMSFIWLLFRTAPMKEDSTVDWVKEGAVTPARDQGRCGSCWAFSATGALEGQMFRKTGKLIPLSIQNLVDCTRSEPYENLGCQGGMMNAAFQYIRDYGIATEQSYPYEIKDSQCRYNTSMMNGTCRGYAVVSGEEAIMKALRLEGPVSVAIDATNIKFRFYRSGLYRKEKCVYPESSNHAVLAVGYGDIDGQGYWLVKNSWGSSWGEDGFVKLSRDCSCGLEDYAIYPIV